MNGLSGISASLPEELFSESERKDYMARLWKLLGEQVARYTMGESSSVPEELASELLGSVLYTLDFAAEKSGRGQAALRGELDALLREGQALLFEECRSVKRLWQRVRSCSPRVDNVYYRSTLEEAGGYFAHYNVLFFADRVCGSLDYPLIAPVPETLKGMSYMREYLKRMNIENRIINAFEPALVDRLLCASVPEYKNMFFNLCLQPLTNAAGLAILRREPKKLDISEEERSLLAEILGCVSKSELEALLKGAAQRLCRDIGRDDAVIIEYAAHALEDIQARLEGALRAGDISNVFVSFLPEGIGTAFPV